MLVKETIHNQLKQNRCNDLNNKSLKMMNPVVSLHEVTVDLSAQIVPDPRLKYRYIYISGCLFQFLGLQGRMFKTVHILSYSQDLVLKANSQDPNRM